MRRELGRFDYSPTNTDPNKVEYVRGKIFSANHISGAIVKPFAKPYLKVFKNIKIMHTNSASIDVHCHKI